MASYSAVIDLRVNGLQQLEAVEARVDAVNKLIKQVKPIPNIFDQRDVARVKAVKKELDFIVKAYADGNTVVAKFSGSIAGLNSQLNGFRTIAANAKVGAEQFTNALKAAEIASSKLAGAELKRLNTLGDLYTRKPVGGLTAEEQGPSGLTRAVLDLGKTLPKSLAGLRTYANELDRIFTLVEAGSVDFRTLQAEIARVNRQMDIAGGAGPMQGPALPPSMRGGGGGRRGATSPIGGGRGFPGSPGALAAQAENLMLGAGFPLLFGGGPAQVAGGLLGSFIGTGFGGQIAGAALAQQLADATTRITEIGNALDTLSMDNLRDSIIYVNADLDTTVRRLIEAGDAQEAQKVAAQAVFEQTGMLPEAVARISNNSNVLANTWNQFSAAASGTLSIIGQPFVVALQLITSGLTKILQYSNYILTAAGEWLDKHLGWIAQNPIIQSLLANILNGNTAITEEQEKQNALLQEATGKLREELALVTKLDALKQAEVSNATFYGQIKNEELRKQAELVKLEDEYNKKRIAARKEYAGLELAEYEKKLDQIEQVKRKEIERNSEEKKRILLLKQADADRTLALQQQTTQLNLQANAVQQQLSFVQAQAQAQTAINNIEIQTLEQVKEIVGAYDTKIRIINQILRLEVANAKIAFNSAVAQIKANERLAELARIAAIQKLKNLEIDLLSAAAKGEEVTNYQKAVMAGKEAVDIATQNLDFTRQIGAEQLRAAEATYNAAVQAANLKAQTSAAAAAAERFAGAMTEAAVAAGATAEATAMSASATSLARVLPGPSALTDAEAMQRRLSVAPISGLFGKKFAAQYEERQAAMASETAQRREGLRASLNPQVNVTTGPVMQMDGTNYVTQRDLMAATGSAARQGADLAMQMLQRSPATRRRTGVNR